MWCSLQWLGGKLFRAFWWEIVSGVLVGNCVRAFWWEIVFGRFGGKLFQAFWWEIVSGVLVGNYFGRFGEKLFRASCEKTWIIAVSNTSLSLFHWSSFNQEFRFHHQLTRVSLSIHRWQNNQDQDLFLSCFLVLSSHILFRSYKIGFNSSMYLS